MKNPNGRMFIPIKIIIIIWWKIVLLIVSDDVGGYVGSKGKLTNY